MPTDRPTWRETRIKMARDLGQRSLCERDQVGALITDVHGKVIGEGYNGPPSGFKHAGQRCTGWCERASSVAYLVGIPMAEDYSDCPALHAEANALMMSDRTLRLGGAIYVTSHVCLPCAKLIANSGLRYVYVESLKSYEHRRPEDSYRFLKNCGLIVIVNEEPV